MSPCTASHLPSFPSLLMYSSSGLTLGSLLFRSCSAMRFNAASGAKLVVEENVVDVSVLDLLVYIMRVPTPYCNECTCKCVCHNL